MNKRKQQIVVGLGELLWDCFANSRRPGGAPANVAFHAKQLGHEGIVCSRVGEDELGAEILEYLDNRGMETKQIQRDRNRPTGRVTVDVSRKDAPSYVIHEDVAWDYLEFDEALESLMASASAVCFGTLAQRSARSRETIHRALHKAAAAGAIVVYDVNIRQSWHQKEWIENSLKASDIVKLNEDEVTILSQVMAKNRRNDGDIAHAFIEQYELDIVCITRAERGCSLYTSSHDVDVPGVEVEVADAVGAGDAFTGALISSRLRGWSLDKSAWFANQMGALVAGHRGAMPTLKNELGQLITSAETRIHNDEGSRQSRKEWE